VIRIAIADDSPFTCRLLAAHLEASGRCCIVGVAHDAVTTVALVKAERPDVLTLDLEMPGADGLDLLRRLMDDTPVPVVVISGVSRRAAAITLQALDIGAVDVVLKYTPGVPANADSLKREIVRKVIAAAEAKIGRARRTTQDRASCSTLLLPRRSAARPRTGPGLVVIGASTGGPTAVRELLAELPGNFPDAVLIVQHLPAALTHAFALLLDKGLSLVVQEASPSHSLEAGRALVVPGGCHVIVKPSGRFELTVRDPNAPLCSIDEAMGSAAEAYGRDVSGVVLTGMGSDGAEGLKQIRARGGSAYVQDAESCVIAGMPVRALEAAGADYIGSPVEIGRALAQERRAA
jgi:two-component system, chemotaxis family, protein-glutamate methylesterase/glutaminase